MIPNVAPTVVISTRASSGMKQSGRGMHAYRQATSPTCFVRNPDGSDSALGKRRLWHRPAAAPPAPPRRDGGLQDRERLVEVVHCLRLHLGGGWLGVESLAQGDGCRYLGCADGAQLGVQSFSTEPLWQGRILYPLFLFAVTMHAETCVTLVGCGSQ